MIFKELEFFIYNGKNYLLMNEIIGDVCLLSSNGKILVIPFSETYEIPIDWIKGIFAYGDDIGYFHNGTNNDQNHLIEPLSQIHIDRIIEDNNICKVEIRSNKPGIDGYEPIKLNGKIIVYPV